MYLRPLLDLFRSDLRLPRLLPSYGARYLWIAMLACSHHATFRNVEDSLQCLHRFTTIPASTASPTPMRSGTSILYVNFVHHRLHPSLTSHAKMLAHHRCRCSLRRRSTNCSPVSPHTSQLIAALSKHLTCSFSHDKRSRRSS